MRPMTDLAKPSRASTDRSRYKHDNKNHPNKQRKFLIQLAGKSTSQKPPQEILYRILGFQAEFLAKPVTGFLDAVRLQ